MYMEPHGAIWSIWCHVWTMWSHVGQHDATCAPIGYTGALGFQQVFLLLRRAELSPILCTPLGMIGNADAGWFDRQFGVPLSVGVGTLMKGGAISNFLYPLGMTGDLMKGGAIANFVCPSRFDWGRQWRAELSPIFRTPLGMIGGTSEGRSYRQFLHTPLGMIGAPVKGGAIANFSYPSRYGWGPPLSRGAELSRIFRTPLGMVGGAN